MTDNSPVYWDIELVPDEDDWFSLHTYTWSVKSFGGRRFMSPSKRGEDLQLPYRQGRLYIPKTRENQIFDMNMWVFPLKEDGKRDPDKTVEQKAHENWRKIISAVDQEGQFRLRKRWYGDDSTTTDPIVVSAVALAEFIEGSGPDSDDGKSFDINLTLSLADPYFYGAQTEIETFEDMLPATGEVPTTHVYLSLGAGEQATFDNGNWIKNNHSSTVIIDCNAATAMVGSTYVNGKIKRNSAFMEWPTLAPGTTVTGTGSLVYEPAYR